MERALVVLLGSLALAACGGQPTASGTAPADTAAGDATPTLVVEQATDQAQASNGQPSDESADDEPGGQVASTGATATGATTTTGVTTTTGAATTRGAATAAGAVAATGGVSQVPATTEERNQERTQEPSASLGTAPAPAGTTIAQGTESGGNTPRPLGWTPEDPASHSLSIERMRGLAYPGSDLQVVEELPAGSNYSRAVATYMSEGLVIRGLLTIPNGEPPASGWPVIIFNHGYIPPAQYRTTERYVAYQDAFAKNGYITFKSDYRGHGSSQGEASGGRGSPDYTIDVLNAMASVARHPAADENRIGMWGHSMGGSVTLRSMVVSKAIRAGVIWAGVVASYPDMYNRLGQSASAASGSPPPGSRRSWRLDLVERFGTPEENPEAWAAVSPNAFLDQISGPLQLHHGTADHSVPVEYSTRLQEQMDAAGRPSEIFIYDGDDHNLAGSLSTALARSVEFFDRHVKGAQ